MHKRIAILIVILFLLTSLSISFESVNHGTAGVSESSNAISPNYVSPINATTLGFNNSTNASAPIANALGALNYSSTSSSYSSKFLYIPSSASKISYSDGHVQPSYLNSPAPIGIGDFGLRNESGKVQGYEYNTSSFQGSITINSSNAFYLENDAPHSFSIQLNSILTGVTVFGNSSNDYWTQNVAFYSTRTHLLSFVSNIWNFTSANATMHNSTIAFSNGTQYYYPGVYIAIGPELNVTGPFTLDLYLNSTVIGSNDAVYFNYSITYSNGTKRSGQYDMVEFDSGYSYSNNYKAMPAMYSVNGNRTAPNGLLLDSEFVLGGPGGGSNSEFYGMNATMNLYYLNSKSEYTSVPAAYNFGADTGETASGISETYNGARTVSLDSGPSILFGMWNTASSGDIASYHSGSVSYSGVVSPSNGFMFVSPGKNFSYSDSAWVPLSSTGEYSFKLPYGNFTAIEMMAMHTPQIFPLASDAKPMAYNPAEGIYTPLVAMDNAQLANISSSGTGTENEPYVLYNASYGSSMNPLFSTMNDFTFPEFSGIILHNITDHVIVSNAPSYKINYLAAYSYILTVLGLPDTNNLNIEIYNSTNISIQDNAHITGWFSALLQGFPLANLVVWNSTNIIISGNLFDSLGSSVLIYNSNATYSNNTITGNTFAIEYTSNYAFSSSYLYGYYDYGLELYSSNNTIYNNYFATILPIYSPSYDIYTGSGNVTYENSFNHSAAGTNIIGGKGINGNYWMNYIGFSTYKDYGQISGTGENVPLAYSYGANISSSGIYPSTPWEIIVYTMASINGTPSILAGLESVQGINANYSLPNGTYDYIAAAEGNYFETQGTFTVQGNYQMIENQFQSNSTYNVTFEANGLPSGKYWFISLDNVSAYTSSNYVTYVGVPNGTYNFSAMSEGMAIMPSTGNITVSGNSELIQLQFTPNSYNLTFEESGLPSGTKWSININGAYFSTKSQAMSFNATNGTYSYTVSSISGYSAVSGGIAQVNNSNVTVFIKYTHIEIPFPYEAVALSIAAGMIAGLIMMYLASRRKRI